MSDAQRVIKYAALSLAIILIIGICSAILFGVSSLFYAFYDGDSTNDSHFMLTETSSDSLEKIKIELGGASLVVKEGTSFKLDYNQKYIEVTEENKTIKIKSKKKLVMMNHNSEVVLYIPEDRVIKDFDLEAGAGKVTIEALRAENVDLELGAGKVEIDYINASNTFALNGGAGKVEIKDGEINNLDANMGVGKFTLKARLTGVSNMDLGVGASFITLIGTKLDYNVKVNKGIGEMLVDGNKIGDGETYGSGDKKVNVSGGVGKVNIRFE